MILLNKEYDGESLSNIHRDVEEALDKNIVEEVGNIPVYEQGILSGVFTVTITWKQNSTDGILIV